jgi:hypothetical protein
MSEQEYEFSHGLPQCHCHFSLVYFLSSMQSRFSDGTMLHMFLSMAV